LQYLRNTMVTIRKAVQEDMIAVHALITELAIYEREPNAVIISVDDLIRHGFSEQRFHCFVAEHKKSGIVGMALYYSRYSTWKGPTLHLEDLYVKPEHRQAGLGKELFDKVVDEATKQNVGRMEWTVLEWNEPALNFYKKYNATLDSEWHLGTLTREQLNALK
jgi:ribosomal protein S18 acetylase RimI-like enzyme